MERGGGEQSVQVQKMRKKAKILQAVKKRGRGSLQTGRRGGVARDSGNSSCGNEIVVHLRVWLWKQSQRRDGRKDGRTCVGTAAAAINAWQQSLQRKKPALGLLLALLGCSPVPTPKSRLTSVHNSPFLFDLIWFLFLTGEIYEMKKNGKWSEPERVFFNGHKCENKLV